jgi:hypothetical protein
MEPHHIGLGPDDVDALWARHRAGVAALKAAKGPPPPPGVGDYFHADLESWGIRPASNCRCAALRREMNALDIEGCTRQFDSLVDRILDGARAGSFDMSGAGRSIRLALKAGIAADAAGVGLFRRIVAYRLRKAIEEARRQRGDDVH